MRIGQGPWRPPSFYHNIDVVQGEVLKGLDITDLEYYTLPPCANIQTTLCE
jgi:hypothetical protein